MEERNWASKHRDSFRSYKSSEHTETSKNVLSFQSPALTWAKACLFWGEKGHCPGWLQLGRCHHSTLGPASLWPYSGDADVLTDVGGVAAVEGLVRENVQECENSEQLYHCLVWKLYHLQDCNKLSVQLRTSLKALPFLYVIYTTVCICKADAKWMIPNCSHINSSIHSRHTHGQMS